MSDTKRKDGFLLQAGILAAASILCRIIGMLYKSPLTAILGDEGNGYYTTAYNIYTIVLLISSYSIPSAVSKVIAQKLALKEYRNAQKLFRGAILYVIVVGSVAGMFLFFGAPLFVMGKSIPVVRVFVPTIFFYGLLGVLRGYFQAHRTMLQTSVSQIMEQILNAAVSMGGAYLLMKLAAEGDQSTRGMYGAIGSAIGTGAGVLIALLFMFLIYMLNRSTIQRRINHDRTKNDMSYGDIFKVIIAVVTPFILSTCIYNISTTLNQTLYLKLMVLVKEIDVIQATKDYGILSTKAIGISNIPIALSSAMSAAIMPTIATAYAQKAFKETRKKIASAIKVTMFIAIPAAVGIGVLARPMVLVLYPQKESLDMASGLLMCLSVSIIFYSLSTLTNAVLQGMGKVNVPVIHASVTLLLQTVILVPLLLFTNLGLYSIVIATIAYSFMMCLLNGRSMKKHLKYKQEMDRTFFRPLFCAAIMGAVAYGTYEGASLLIGLLIKSLYMKNLFALLLAVLVAAPVYFILAVKLKAIREQELKSLPKGRMLAAAAKKMKLL